MTTGKEIENLSEHSGSKTAAALAYLLGYGRGTCAQLHMGCRTKGAEGADGDGTLRFPGR